MPSLAIRRRMTPCRISSSFPENNLLWPVIKAEKKANAWKTHSNYQRCLSVHWLAIASLEVIFLLLFFRLLFFRLKTWFLFTRKVDITARSEGPSADTWDWNQAIWRHNCAHIITIREIPSNITGSTVLLWQEISVIKLRLNVHSLTWS